MRFKAWAVIIIAAMGISFLFWKNRSPRQKFNGTLYDIAARSISGELINFDRYKGKTLLIVNTASKCGYTPQYEQLQKLHELYGDKVTVLGFPANNFLWQEPGSNEEIASFCSINYGVSFQLFEKISVKGSDQHPVYQWLESRTGNKPTWNFCKFLISGKGEFLGFYGPKVSPLDPAILEKI